MQVFLLMRDLICLTSAFILISSVRTNLGMILNALQAFSNEAWADRGRILQIRNVWNYRWIFPFMSNYGTLEGIGWEVCILISILGGLHKASLHILKPYILLLRQIIMNNYLYAWQLDLHNFYFLHRRGKKKLLNSSLLCQRKINIIWCRQHCSQEVHPDPQK